MIVSGVYPAATTPADAAPMRYRAAFTGAATSMHLRMPLLIGVLIAPVASYAAAPCDAAKLDAALDAAPSEPSAERSHTVLKQGLRACAGLETLADAYEVEDYAVQSEVASFIRAHADDWTAGCGAPPDAMREVALAPRDAQNATFHRLCGMERYGWSRAELESMGMVQAHPFGAIMLAGRLDGYRRRDELLAALVPLPDSTSQAATSKLDCLDADACFTCMVGQSMSSPFMAAHLAHLKLVDQGGGKWLGGGIIVEAAGGIVRSVRVNELRVKPPMLQALGMSRDGGTTSEEWFTVDHVPTRVISLDGRAHKITIVPVNFGWSVDITSPGRPPPSCGKWTPPGG